ncbi:unnamed protein product [Tilletia caries]|nr:unnamed protein product [Tilletia caries]
MIDNHIQRLKEGEVDLGTSIMAVAYDEGVIIGADSRTTMGSYIVVHNGIESGDMQLIGEAYYHRLFFFVLERVAPEEKTREKNGENGFAEWGDILTTTTKAYHPAGSELGAAPPTRRLQPRPTLSSARQVEVDLVMHPQTPLWLSHDISQDLQDRIEDLPMVERAFIHVDHETDHRPEHRKNV